MAIDQAQIDIHLADYESVTGIRKDRFVCPITLRECDGRGCPRICRAVRLADGVHKVRGDHSNAERGGRNAEQIGNRWCVNPFSHPPSWESLPTSVALPRSMKFPRSGARDRNLASASFWQTEYVHGRSELIRLFVRHECSTEKQEKPKALIENLAP